MAKKIQEALVPSLGVLAKIGSMLVHVDEAASSGGHPFDLAAFKSVMGDPAVQAWLSAMEDAALIPVRRMRP